MEGNQVATPADSKRLVIDYFFTRLALANRLAQLDEETIIGPAKLIHMPEYLKFETVYLHPGQRWTGKGIVWSRESDEQKES